MFSRLNRFRSTRRMLSVGCGVLRCRITRKSAGALALSISNTVICFQTPIPKHSAVANMYKVLDEEKQLLLEKEKQEQDKQEEEKKLQEAADLALFIKTNKTYHTWSRLVAASLLVPQKNYDSPFGSRLVDIDIVLGHELCDLGNSDIDKMSLFKYGYDKNYSWCQVDTNFPTRVQMWSGIWIKPTSEQFKAVNCILKDLKAQDYTAEAIFITTQRHASKDSDVKGFWRIRVTIERIKVARWMDKWSYN